jgi:hypothetical protein
MSVRHTRTRTHAHTQVGRFPMRWGERIQHSQGSQRVHQVWSRQSRIPVRAFWLLIQSCTPKRLSSTAPYHRVSCTTPPLCSAVLHSLGVRPVSIQSHHVHPALRTRARTTHLHMLQRSALLGTLELMIVGLSRVISRPA